MASNDTTDTGDAPLIDQQDDFLHHGANRKKGDSDQKTLFSHVNNAFDQHRTLLP
jgi:hypothetical protein